MWFGFDHTELRTDSCAKRWPILQTFWKRNRTVFSITSIIHNVNVGKLENNIVCWPKTYYCSSLTKPRNGKLFSCMRLTRALNGQKGLGPRLQIDQVTPKYRLIVMDPWSKFLHRKLSFIWSSWNLLDDIFLGINLLIEVQFSYNSTEFYFKKGKKVNLKFWPHGYPIIAGYVTLSDSNLSTNPVYLFTFLD